MNVIKTRFMPATNYRPARIKATCCAGSLTVSYEHGMNSEANHVTVAAKLRQKVGWIGGHYATWCLASDDDGTHYHSNVSDNSRYITKRITSGASYCDETMACGTLDCALRYGYLSCGSGDDHVLTGRDLQEIEQGLTDLTPGPLNSKTKGTIGANR